MNRALRWNVAATALGRAVAVVVVSAMMGCGTTTSPVDPPEAHTEVHGGVAHGANAKEATTRCTVCHGATLQGGATAPSCFTCHGKKWQ